MVGDGARQRRGGAGQVLRITGLVVFLNNIILINIYIIK